MPNEQIKDPKAQSAEAKSEPALTKTVQQEQAQRTQALRRQHETEHAERRIRSLSRP